MNRMKKVLEMLTYRRPAGSEGELAFLARYVLPLKPVDICDNQIIVVPGDPETLFSCHTDTVHRDDKRQKVIFDKSLGIAYKDDKEPLGADNTAGVWLLLEMIMEGIPGTYAFHYGEERGCLGSRDMAEKKADWLKTFKRAIAFDRRATHSIITHQMGTRTCSDSFGEDLAFQLGGSYALDPTGSFTDTASYPHLIAECTNVSVGYDHEHGPNETLDLEHLMWLRDRVMTVKWSELITRREPAPESSRDYLGDDDDYTGWLRDLTTAEVDRYINLSLTEIGAPDDVEMLIIHEPELAAKMLLAYVTRQDEYERRDEAAAALADAELVLELAQN